ncbi:MAG TPA: hypothetical protein VJ922_06645 [Actinomycetota bacterium]|nr:hypothetical protein [Actinomycetota bacterium]
MGIFRKRHEEEREAELGLLLESYSAPTPPAATHSKVETIRCWRCHRPTVFDARLAPPKTCAWCRAQL